MQSSGVPAVQWTPRRGAEEAADFPSPQRTLSIGLGMEMGETVAMNLIPVPWPLPPYL
jgi:hypothetical protein